MALIAVQILFGTWPIFGKIVLRSMSPASLVLQANEATLIAKLWTLLDVLLKLNRVR